MRNLVETFQFRLLPAIPSWLFLVAGITLIAMAALTPAWQDCRRLAWQQRVITLQADRIAEQHQAYEQYLTALKNDNPILLERLAFERLLVKPDQSTAINPLPTETTAPVAITDWLHRPLPQPGLDYQPLPPMRTALTRITHGPTRLLLIALAGTLLAFAFIPPGVTRTDR